MFQLQSRTQRNSTSEITLKVVEQNQSLGQLEINGWEHRSTMGGLDLKQLTKERAWSWLFASKASGNNVSS